MTNLTFRYDWKFIQIPFLTFALQKRTYNKSKPFSSHLIIDIIESVWFSTNARSNLDAETTTKMVADRDIPLSIILLILCVVCFIPYIYI